MSEISTQTNSFSKYTKSIVVVIIVMVCFVEGFSTSSLIPALPAISKHFGLKIGFVQIAIPVYFLGFLVQIPYGFLADCYGRKKIFLFCYTIFALGSILCFLENNYLLFLVGRFLQGTGMCSVYLYRSIFCDIFSEKQLKSVYSALHGILVFVSALGPIIGGYLNFFLGWRYIFITSFFLAVGMFLIIAFVFPETLKQKYQPQSLCKTFINKNMLLLKNKILIICALCSMICFTGVYVIFSISPFLFQNVLNWSTHKYGFFAFCFLLAIAAGSTFNNILTKKPFLKIMSTSNYLIFLLCILMTINHYLPLYTTTTVLLIFAFCFLFGIIHPNTFLYSVKTINKDVDAGTSFMFFSTIRTIGVLLLFPISLLHTQSSVIMGILLFFVSITIFFLLMLLKKESTTPSH